MSRSNDNKTTKGAYLSQRAPCKPPDAYRPLVLGSGVARRHATLPEHGGRLAHVYTIGEGYEQRIDRLYVHLPPIAGLVLLRSLLSEQQKANDLWQAQASQLKWKPTCMAKSLPGLAGKMRVIHTLPPQLERATMEAIYNSLHVNHVWITKFVKLPKDTVGSFIMTFHTDAVADLLGVEEANPSGEPELEEDLAGIPGSQVEVSQAVELSSQWVGRTLNRAGSGAKSNRDGRQRKSGKQKRQA